MRNFRDLQVWEKGHRMTLAVYRATATFPHDELYGLTSQMRRSSLSVPANIAEGCGRGSDTDRKSTRLNSSHANISYAVFCLKKKKAIYYTRIILFFISC